ncbi:unnamed protein product [Polarella glacialis]|uniref:USP domain-containing protein n=2 Tax=Polarella glacialis TaxID=89957 RepID=A0A813DPP1_POLGL|nr:unnamed protein product [Polarella glacialis]
MTPFGLSGRQQDVTELARWLLEQLGDADNPRSLAGRCFGIEAKTTVRCSNCGHAQEKKETFADLCLPVVDAAQESAMPMEGGNNNNSNNNNDNSKDNNMCLETDQPEAKCQKTASRRGVAELLRLYLSEEALPGYRCDSCESVDSSLRQLAVTKPPDHLMVTLSRFAFTADGGQQKVDAFVSVDKALELPLAAPFSEVAEAAHEVATCPMEATASYALYAIVTHIGSTPHSGHYICLGCRSSSVAAGERDGPWQRFDDAAVSALPSEATQEHLDACANGNATAYILMYQRVDGSCSAAQRPTRPLPSQLFAEAVLQDLGESGTPEATARSSPFPGPGPAGPRGPQPEADEEGGAGMGGGGGWIC